MSTEVSGRTAGAAHGAFDGQPAIDFRCAGKVAHASRSMAARVLKGMQRRKKGKAVTAGLEVYRCPRCTQWHIGRGLGRARPV